MELIVNKKHVKIDNMYKNINYLIDTLSDKDLKFIKPIGCLIENKKLSYSYFERI